jgi:hypothetical protein
MLPDYTYFRSAAPEEELSGYFAERLKLARVDDSSPFPLKNDQWWVRTLDADEDWEEESSRIGLTPDEVVMVIFEPAKGLGSEFSFQADIDLFGAIVDQLNETPELTGLLVHGDVRVLVERQRGGPTLLDPSLADPDDYNHNDHLAPVLARATIAPLVDLD